MTFYFILAVVADRCLTDFLEEVTFALEEYDRTPGCNILGCNSSYFIVNYLRADLIENVDSDAEDKMWNFVLITPQFVGAVNTARLFRYFKRKQIEHPGKLQGPWDLPLLNETHPTIAEQFLYLKTWDNGVVTGINYEAGLYCPISSGDSKKAAQLTYRPTEEEITNDTDVEENFFSSQIEEEIPLLE
jgi:hypothetical protein